MIKAYTVYNIETGEILRRISCPQEMIPNQLEDGEWILQGDWDDTNYKIVNHQPVPYTQKEKDERLFPFIKNNFPVVNNNMNDVELDSVIDAFFLGLVDVAQWKIDNYSWLRKIFYPEYGELLDAEVKSDNEQKEAYVNKCLQIKRRFPKS